MQKGLAKLCIDLCLKIGDLQKSKLCPKGRTAGRKGGKMLHLEFSIFLFVLTLTRRNDAKERREF